MFTNLLSALRIGGATIDTVFNTRTVQPGSTLTGVCRIKGGSVAQVIDNIDLDLCASVRQDEHGYRTVILEKGRLLANTTIQANEIREYPFEFKIPIGAPITAINGDHLRMGGKVWLATNLGISKAMDASDTDTVLLEPLPAQVRVLQSFERLGFRLIKVDLEYGSIAGHNLNFYQEFEYSARGTRFGSRFNEVEVTFLCTPHMCDVLLEIDKRGGFFTSGRDVFRRFSVPYQGFETMNIEATIEQILTKG